MGKKRAADSILEGLLQAKEHAEGHTASVRTTRVKIEPLPEMDSRQIKEIRMNAGLTQVVFARAIGVSPKSIEAWECGRNQPQGPALRLLDMVRKDPEILHRQNIIQQ